MERPSESAGIDRTKHQPAAGHRAPGAAGTGHRIRTGAAGHAPATASELTRGAAAIGHRVTRNRPISWPVIAALLALAGVAVFGATSPKASAAPALTYFPTAHPISAGASTAPGQPATLLADDGVRSIAAIGEVATAENVAVIVPGTDTDRQLLGDHGPVKDSLLDQAGNVLTAMNAADPNARNAAVIFQYQAPSTKALMSILTADDAEAAAPALETLRQHLGDVHVTWVCHSYGSLVCGKAKSAVRSGDDMVLLASPGAGVENASDLQPAQVWAGTAADDPVSLAGLADDLHLGVFGAMPTDPAFGAQVINVPSGGHSGYLRHPGPTLTALGEIATSQPVPSALLVPGERKVHA